MFILHNDGLFLYLISVACPYLAHVKIDLLWKIAYNIKKGLHLAYCGFIFKEGKCSLKLGEGKLILLL